MKRYFIFIGMLMWSFADFAQVAINTDGSDPAPGTILHIKSDAAVKPDVTVQQATGYVGLGTITPQDRLDIWGGARMSLDADNYVRVFGNPANILGYDVFEGTTTIEGDYIQRYAFLAANASGGYDTIFSLLRPTQSVGIGTNLPKGKVHVRVTDADLANLNGSIGLEYDNFSTWQGLGLYDDPDIGVQPFLGYGPEEKGFAIIQFTEDNRSIPSETRMTFLPTGHTGIGDPSSHRPPDAALMVSNGPIWHLMSNYRAPILTLYDNDTLRVIVDPDGFMSFPNGGGINSTTINGSLINATTVNTTTANVQEDLSVNNDAYVNGEFYADKANIMTSLEVAGTTDLYGDLSAMDALFDGDVMVTGTVELQDANKLTRSNQNGADLLPIAYGVVDSDGTIISGTGNFSANRNSEGEYYISVDNETITENYTIVVTTQDIFPLITSTTDDNGSAVIYLYDLNGDYTDGRFQFVIYRP